MPVDARKDPEGENAAHCLAPLPMVSLAKSEEPSAFQSRMTDPVCDAAMQVLKAPPAKNRELMLKWWGLLGMRKAWTRALALLHSTL